MLYLSASNITVAPTYGATKYVPKSFLMRSLIFLFKLVIAIILAMIALGFVSGVTEALNDNIIGAPLQEKIDIIAFWIIIIALVVVIILMITASDSNMFPTKELTSFRASLPNGWVMEDDIKESKSSEITELTINNISQNSRINIKDIYSTSNMVNQLKTPNSDLWKLILSAIAIMDKTEYTDCSIYIAKGYCARFSRQWYYINLDKCPKPYKKPGGFTTVAEQIEYEAESYRMMLNYMREVMAEMAKIPAHLKPGAQKRTKDLPVYIYSSNAMEMIYTLDNKLVDLHSISNSFIEQQPMQLILRLLVGQSNNKYIYTLKLHVPSFVVNHSNLLDQMYKTEQEWAQSSNAVASLNLDDTQVSQTWLNLNMPFLLDNLKGK